MLNAHVFVLCIMYMYLKEIMSKRTKVIFDFMRSNISILQNSHVCKKYDKNRQSDCQKWYSTLTLISLIFQICQNHIYVKIKTKKAKVIAESDFRFEPPAKIRSSAFSPRPEIYMHIQLYKSKYTKETYENI